MKERGRLNADRSHGQLNLNWDFFFLTLSEVTCSINMYDFFCLF